MKNPGWANNRGSPPYISRNSSYQIPLSLNAPAAMILKPKTACGDEDGSLSILGLCSDFYVSKRVTTLTAGSSSGLPETDLLPQLKLHYQPFQTAKGLQEIPSTLHHHRTSGKPKSHLKSTQYTKEEQWQQQQQRQS
jgi:hypothetical protein